MMTDEQAYIDTIASKWPKDEEASLELLVLAEEAFPLIRKVPNFGVCVATLFK
jgi:hypothetical protein